jgi:hypothetical protein
MKHYRPWAVSIALLAAIASMIYATTINELVTTESKN